MPHKEEKTNSTNVFFYVSIFLLNLLRASETSGTGFRCSSDGGLDQILLRHEVMQDSRRFAVKEKPKHDVAESIFMILISKAEAG